MNSCENCSHNFDLGLHKPINFCCFTRCYSCVFALSSSSSTCPICKGLLPSLDSLKVNSSILDNIQNSSQKIKDLKKLEGPNASKCLNCNSKSMFKLPKSKNEICGECLTIGHRKKHYYEDFKCASGHSLYSYSSMKLLVKCYLCSFHEGTYSHCFKCGVHLCVKCSELLVSVASSLSNIHCRCQGDLIWQSRTACERCSSCSRNFSKLGRFFCANCSTSLCFSCTLNRFNEISCFQCHNSFNIRNIPVLGPNNENYCKTCVDSTSLDRDLLIIFTSLCHGNHEINPENFANFEGICEICRKTKLLLTCSNCNEGVCKKCQEWCINSVSCTYGNCLQGHFLRRTSLEFWKSGGKGRRCGSCNKEIVSESFHCRTCDSDQCSECFSLFKRSVQMKTRIFFKEQFFEFVFYKKCSECCNCLSSYEKWGCFCSKTSSSKLCFTCVGQLSPVECSSCSSTSDLARTSCEHIFCKTCYSSIMDSPSPKCPICPTKQAPVNPLLLNTGQKLVTTCQPHYFVKLPQQDKCRYCNKTKNISVCTSCNTKSCKKCKIWQIDSSSIPENFSCSENHILKQTPNAQEFYKNGGKFKCDGCAELGSGASLHCFKCKLDYCMNCYSDIKFMVQSFTFFKCGLKGCSGKVEWNPKKAGKKCSKCTQKFNKSGFFHCLKCKVLWCIKCSKKSRKESCKVCNKVFTQAMVSPALTEDQVVVCENCLNVITISKFSN